MRTRLRRHEVQVQNQCGDAPDENHRKRVKYILYTFLVVFGVITLRLAMLHLNPRDELSREEVFHFGKIVLQRDRGNIIDTNGKRLATNLRVPSLWANPSVITDPDRLAMLASEKLGMEYTEAYEILTKKNSAGVPLRDIWLKRFLPNVSPEVIEEIEQESGGAIRAREESMRYYPQGDTAAHIIGFAGVSGDDIEGREGIELAFDSYLTTEPGEYRARKDARRRLLSSTSFINQPPVGGDDVELTIDATIQHFLEDAIDRRIAEREAPRGMGVVMDPYTGAIVALASRPGFDPNFYEDYPLGFLKNRALLDRFEPGSVMKIVPAAAALEHGLITPATIIDCEWGHFNPYGHTIKDISKMGEEPFTTCFAKSSNIAIVKVAKLLGPERLEAWITRFGFGQTTSSDFLHESTGRFRPLRDWNKLSMGSLPMGQEISVTIMQVARAFSVIANGGFLIDPYIVERAIAVDGSITYQHEAPEPQRMISPRTAATMQELCHEVVVNGTGKAAAIPQYRSGGKSGTAQMAYLDRRGYDPDRNTAVYAGFAPINKPRLVCVVVIQEPKLKPRYGGYTCGPVFSEVLQNALTHMQVPADPEPDYEAIQPEAVEESQDADLIVARLDDGEIAEIERSFEDSPELLFETLDDLELVSSNVDPVPGVGGLPDLTGLNKAQAQARLRELGVDWNPTGSGWVVAQAPLPGTPLDQVSLCSLEFGARRVEEVVDETESNL